MSEQPKYVSNYTCFTITQDIDPNVGFFRKKMPKFFKKFLHAVNPDGSTTIDYLRWYLPSRPSAAKRVYMFLRYGLIWVDK